MKILLHHLLLFTINFLPPSVAQHSSPTLCGQIRIQKGLSLLNRMVLCKSQKLYFKTSLGLYQISFIDYTNKLLTVSHSSCSSSSNYVSPSLLSAGFPSPPHPNSLALFGCSSNNHEHQVKTNCSGLHGCTDPSSCLLVNDIRKLKKGFHPKDLNCSGYSGVYRTSSDDDNIEGYKLGTTISFDVPDHVPSLCEECNKPHGNCGIGLRCVCHPKECKDRVVSMSSSVTVHPRGNIIFLLIFFVAMMSFVKDS
ncbi:hypothetical protein NMG60_11033349 [Bertholletia excelsa]